MDELDTTNQADETEVSDTGVEAEVQDTEPQLDDYGNPIEDQADVEDEDELDIDGHKVKLPKSVAEKLNAERLMQADYTRKTQELAEQRKAFDAERQSYQQADANELAARGNLSLIDQKISEFGKVDWRAWQQNDPFAAQEAFTQYQLLKDARTETAKYLGHVEQERTVKQQQEAAKRLEEGAAQLAKDIPDWSPATAAKLLDFGQKQYGFSKQDLDGIDDPRLIKVLHAASQWEEHQAKTKRTQTAQKQQEVKPAATVGRSAAPASGLSDKLSADEWLKRRNAQLQKRG